MGNVPSSFADLIGESMFGERVLWTRRSSRRV